MNWFKEHLFAIKMSLQGIERKPFHFLYSCFVLSLSLIIPLSIILTYNNSNTLPKKFFTSSNINVFFKSDIEENEILLIEKEIFEISRSLNFKIHTNFIPKSLALENLKANKNLQNLSKIFEDNPLPDTLIIKLKNSFFDLNFDYVDSLANNISQLQGIEETSYNKNQIMKDLNLQKFLIVFLSFFIIIVYSILFISLGYVIYLQIINKEEDIFIFNLLGSGNQLITKCFQYHIGFICFISALLAIFLIFLFLLFSKNQFESFLTIELNLKMLFVQNILLISKIILVFTFIGIVFSNIVIKYKIKRLS
tara:strand:- start:98 stop:1021 length:924 start_codon:yes stop_codon:yes gene_type:complete